MVRFNQTRRKIKAHSKMKYYFFLFTSGRPPPPPLRPTDTGIRVRRRCFMGFPVQFFFWIPNKAGRELDLNRRFVDMLAAVAQICSTPSIARNISICTDVIRRSAASGAKVGQIDYYIFFPPLYTLLTPFDCRSCISPRPRISLPRPLRSSRCPLDLERAHSFRRSATKLRIMESGSE